MKETIQKTLGDFPELRDVVWALHFNQHAIRKFQKGQAIIYDRWERPI